MTEPGGGVARRAHGRLAAAVVTVLTVVSVVAALSACSPTSSAGSAGSAPTLREVRSALATYAGGVLHRDRADVDATLAEGAASAGFRARQRAAFDNLAQVPLARWSYSLVDRAGDAGADRAATTRYASAAVIVRVSLSYALRGVDPVPSTHDLWWTFVRQGGRARVAGDTDLDGAAGRSWRGPWDFGSIQAVRGARSLVLARAGEPVAELREVAAAVDAAVPAVTAVWGRDWSQRVAVLIPGSSAEFAADAGATGSPGDDVAALAVSDAAGASDASGGGTAAGGSDTGAGAVPGQRLIVNPDALRKLSAVGRRIVIRHEVTHLAAAAATSPATPRWIVEGFAEYVGNLGTGQSVPTAASELKAQLRARGLPATLPGDTELAGDAASAAPAYESAWLACRLIAAQVGTAGLVRFYRQAAGPAVTGDPVTQALVSVVHETPARFVAQWRRYLTAQLGG